MRRVWCASLIDTMAGKKKKGSPRLIRKQRQEAKRMDRRPGAVGAAPSGRLVPERNGGRWQVPHQQQHQQQQYQHQPIQQQYMPVMPHARFYPNGMPIPPYAPMTSPPPQFNQSPYAPPAFNSASISGQTEGYSPHEPLINGPVSFNGGHYNPAFLPQFQRGFFEPTPPVWDQHQRWGAPCPPFPYTQNQQDYQQHYQQANQPYPQSQPPNYQNAPTHPAPAHGRGQGGARPNVRPRAGSPPASTSGSGPYVRPQRRVKRARDAPPPEPNEAYLAVAQEPSSVLPEPISPPCLVLDLNNTLLFRKKRDASGSRSPIARPYLATFLNYLVSQTTDGSPRWILAVYSSARAKNVLALLAAVGLVDHERANSVQGGQSWEAEEGDALALVWSREKMGLTPREFDLDVETSKDLDPLWRVLGGELGPRRTVLLDDEEGKAATQPYNHLPIEPFLLDPSSLPPSSPPRWASLPRGFRAPSVDLPRASATEIASTHPCGQDEALLSTIYLLEQLREQSNIAGFIRNGGLKRTDIVDEGKRIAWARKFCRAHDIPVTRDWDPNWFSSP
ncbi:BZ3500_MvSof-1268-A1-R1_Chr10-2g02936 [Microbotryum saponariae]|uniref:Mitochondrial import inner membrane translocase subunit TIM50 n=1 Tax=Microbotryum saponariae TaxID=289078 RepID=A0A2X0MB76_9BASI|nr:BZ3501_MvSof-1269-A2-R1_Chr10-2g02522 [Microbotryum saponariae]SDA01776.1 BZ3500_MvSof-1268-A1-R1_Chr10-2g02936 [Microbotryum saponariae]